MHELFIRSSLEAFTNSLGISSCTGGTAAAADSSPGGEDRVGRVPTTANGTNFWHLPPVRKDDLSRRIASYRIVRLFMESWQLRPYLLELLTARNSDNLTPFMLAVKCRAYEVATFLYKAFQSLLSAESTLSTQLTGRSADQVKRDFLAPILSRPDDSPLFQLCYNDTCSFTWTGPDHIRQDIFECRTCGLMDSLCCCTECARVCHKGHDCRLKRTSPTAYCDCWEKCRCQSLIAGAQAPRQELFHTLLKETDLIRLVNARHEHLLVFLVRTVERQFREQKQHRPPRRRLSTVVGGGTVAGAGSEAGGRSGAAGQQASSGWDVAGSGVPEEPSHDLDPPRFTRDALEMALDSPVAVESILNLATELCPPPRHTTASASTRSSGFLDENNLLFSQGGTNQLDDFVFTLISKCPRELMDVLLSTITRSLLRTDKPQQQQVPGNPEHSEPLQVTATGADRNQTFVSTSDAVVVPVAAFQQPSPEAMRRAAGRFVRSVARIYVGLSLELTADHKKKRSRLISCQPSPLDTCRHVFSQLAAVALAELPAIAVGLLSPLRSGTVRPTVPFPLLNQPSAAVTGLDQLFTAERTAISRQQLYDGLESSQPPQSSQGHISTVPSWGVVARSVDDSRQESHPTSSASTVRAGPAPGPTTVVSQLRVELVPYPAINHHQHQRALPAAVQDPRALPPPLSQSPSASPNSLPVAQADGVLAVVSPASPTQLLPAVMHDPSQLTRQIQSAIGDIDSAAVDETAQLAYADDSRSVGDQLRIIVSGSRFSSSEADVAHDYVQEMDSEMPEIYTGHSQGETFAPGAWTSSSALVPQQEDVNQGAGQSSSSDRTHRRHESDRPSNSLRGAPAKRRRTIEPPMSEHAMYHPGERGSPRPPLATGETEDDLPGPGVCTSGSRGQALGEFNLLLDVPVSSRHCENMASRAPLDVDETASNSSVDTLTNVTAIATDGDAGVHLFSSRQAGQPGGPTYHHESLNQPSSDAPPSYSLVVGDSLPAARSQLLAEEPQQQPRRSEHAGTAYSGEDSQGSDYEEEDEDELEEEEEDAYEEEDNDHGDNEDNDEEDLDGDMDEEDECEEIGVETGGDGEEHAEEEEDESDDDDDDDGEDDDEGEDVDDDNFYGDDDDEWFECEEEDDDEEHEEMDDDSSHHSDDASGAEAASRSVSPTWLQWPRDPVYSRILPRLSTITTTASTTNEESRRAAAGASAAPSSTVSDGTSSSVTVSSASVPATGGHGLTRSPALLPNHTGTPRRNRASVHSVINLLSGSSNTAAATLTTATTVTNNSRLTSGATASAGSLGSAGSTAGANSDENADYNQTGSLTTTQAHLSRGFACLVRVIADLMVEMRSCTTNAPLRRCASMPTNIIQSALSPSSTACERQRLSGAYSSSIQVSNANTPLASSLLLSSPMSSMNLSTLVSQHLLYTGGGAVVPPHHSSSSLVPRQSSLTRTTATVSRTQPTTSFPVSLTSTELTELIAAFGVAMIPVWRWLAHALDNLEARLRFSSAWSSYLRVRHSTPSAAGGSGFDAPDNSNQTRRDNAGPVVSSRQGAAGRFSSLRSGSHSASTPGGRSSQADADSFPREALSTGNTLAATGTAASQPTAATTSTGALVQRHDFLAYLFSLMRASGSDHGDSPPAIDPLIHKHLAYVLDALLYFFRAFEASWPSGMMHNLTTSSVLASPAVSLTAGNLLSSSATVVNQSDPLVEPLLNSVNDDSASTSYTTLEPSAKHISGPVAQREDSFFRRSESVLSLSGLGVDLVDAPLSESLPLAIQPHRLHPTAERTELFGSARYYVTAAGAGTATSESSPANFPPIHMNHGYSVWGEMIAQGRGRLSPPPWLLPHSYREGGAGSVLTEKLHVGGTFLDSIGHTATLLSRWCLSLEFFGRHFTQDVGAEYKSYILELGGFTVKESRFRAQMERLRNISRRDLVLEVERDRSSLILSSVKQLNAEYAKRQPQPLTVNTSGLPQISGSYLSRLRSNNTSNTTTNTDAWTGGGTTVGSLSNSSAAAVALLLGTTTDSPLLGTLYGASQCVMPSTGVAAIASASSASGPLSCQRVKVVFRDEPGEGSGVARSFFTAFGQAVLAFETLPQLTALVQQPTPPSPLTTGSQTSSSSQNQRTASAFTRSTTAGVSSPATSTASTVSVAPSRYSLLGSAASSNVRSLCTAALSAGGSPSTRAGASGAVTTTANSTSTGATSDVGSSVRAGGTGSSTTSVHISFYPYHQRPPPGSTRARTSAWRRAGGLSSQAASFYPTSTNGLSGCARPQAPAGEGLLPGQDSSPPPAATDASLLQAASESGSSQGQQQQSNGNRLYWLVHRFVNRDHLAARITGMLLELTSAEQSVLLTNQEALRNRVDEARAVLAMANSLDRDYTAGGVLDSTAQSVHTQNQPILERLVNWRGLASSDSGDHRPPRQSARVAAAVPAHRTSSSEGSACAAAEEVERVPLFWQPGLSGYYAPRAVHNPVGCDPIKLAARYSIYRNIGRVIGLCLLTNEICPIHFTRPVLKYLLGRILHWHDFAFHDPTTFEGLRQLLVTAIDQSEPGSSVADYNLNFSLIPSSEEGGVPTPAIRNAGSCSSKVAGGHVGNTTVSAYPLLPGGDELEVDNSNVFEFVKRYAEFKMVECVREPLEQLRLGLFDVLPRNALDGLTAEDLRLLLNGAGEIDPDVLASYTTFFDETGTVPAAQPSETGKAGGSDKVARLKRWFWNIVRSMDHKQRQDLVYFWTSSPTLPASAQGFQPMPSITIRSANDSHLPSANTCISRLYLPLYSSKQILREKLLQAIETKYFGFI